MFKTSNPVFKEEYFSGQGAYAAVGGNTMTIGGTITKTFVLLGIVFIAGMYTWDMYASGAGDRAMGLVFLGVIGGFITAIITCFAKHLAMITAPIYAALEGLALGAFSAIFNARYSGIVIQAVVLTIAVLAIMLAAYKTGIIRPTQRFATGVISATGAICLYYLISMFGGFFGFQMPLIHSNGLFGIIFSVIIVGIAALNLILDFAFIEMGERNGSPKYLEWYGAFSLIVTLVWLYLEILRLLSKINSRN